MKISNINKEKSNSYNANFRPCFYEHAIGSFKKCICYCVLLFFINIVLFPVEINNIPSLFSFSFLGLICWFRWNCCWLATTKILSSWHWFWSELHDALNWCLFGFENSFQANEVIYRKTCIFASRANRHHFSFKLNYSD